MRMRASKKSQARRIDYRLAIPLCAAVLLLGGCSLGRLVAIDYRFVNTLSQPAPEASPPLAVEGPLLAAINTATLESDVRYLASAELEGRGHGTPGNALARAYIVSRLKKAGLTPLFEDAFEQRAFLVNGEGRPTPSMSPPTSRPPGPPRAGQPLWRTTITWGSPAGRCTRGQTTTPAPWRSCWP